ncbi:hypothetical protein KC19_6G222400 [Ceratodon purpureus]|uniref:pyruvate decarboxylase n=1 Tax=Ceratodon purpureus TaxID=3225 RepID=A0A8T0HKC5_CERPU|nr:hypothetical protein KC19_6G222400 [Ceratodon purpureus]
MSNSVCLNAALEATLKKLESAVKPVLIGGPKLRLAKANKAFVTFAEASGFAVATMPSAKGQVPESLSKFIVSIGEEEEYGCVQMGEFLNELAKRVVPNTNAYDNYMRIFINGGEVPKGEDINDAIRVNTLFKHIQEILTADSVVIAETGDSWFNCQRLKLPDGCGYEFQMQYGSIGWSVGALLGYAQATKKRCIACIGDGSFQVTAQDLSTMIRNQQCSIIFLINNGGYTIEVAIHDGPYNVIKNWSYTGVVEAFQNGEGALWTKKVTNEEELAIAIKIAQEKVDMLCFIEVICHKDDTSKELLEWGSRVASANGRPPQPDDVY